MDVVLGEVVDEEAFVGQEAAPSPPQRGAAGPPPGAAAAPPVSASPQRESGGGAQPAGPRAVDPGTGQGGGTGGGGMTGEETGPPGGSPAAGGARRKPLVTAAEEAALVRARGAVAARSSVAGARTGPTEHTSFVNSPPSFPKRPLGYFREIPGPPVGRRLDPRDLEVPAAGPGAAPQLITSRGVQSLAVGGLAGQGPPAAAAAGQPLAPVGQNPPPGRTASCASSGARPRPEGPGTASSSRSTTCKSTTFSEIFLRRLRFLIEFCGGGPGVPRGRPRSPRASSPPPSPLSARAAATTAGFPG